MKKIVLIFLSLYLLLLSSCSDLLNETFGFTKPSDVKRITVYANNGTSDKKEVVMNGGFNWDSTLVDVNTLLSNAEFKKWYESLSYGEYSKLGVYNQNKIDGSTSNKFTISRDNKIFVNWNSPLTEIIFHSNKKINDYSYDTNSTYTFVLPVEDYVPYGETREFNLSYFTKDIKFNDWYNKLYGTGSYSYKNGISTNSGSSEGKKSVIVSKNLPVVYVIWTNNGNTLNGFTIHSNNEKYKDFYYEFDSAVSRKTIYWSDLVKNEDFKEWLDSLKSDDLYVYSISNSVDGSNIKYSITNTNYSETDEFTSYESSSLDIVLDTYEDYYINWKEYVSEIIFDANIDSDSETANTYTYKFEIPKKNQILITSTISDDPEFEEWINNLKKPGYVICGFKYNEIEYKDNTQLSVNSNKEEIKILWEKGVDGITVHANNGTDETFELKLDEAFTTKQFKWLDFQKNEEFIKWYQGLENGVFYTRGLSAKAEMTSDSELMSQYSTDGISISFYKEKLDVYVQWGVRRKLNYVSIYRSGPFIWKPGESYASRFSLYTNNGTYDGSIKSMTFSSDDESVATVNSWGLVEAKGYGVTKIRMKVVAADDTVYESYFEVNIPADPVFERYDMPRQLQYINEIQLTADNSTFYMRGSEPYTGERLYKSTDGINWERMAKGQNFTGDIGTSKDGKYVYGINNNSVYYSNDYGNTIESRMLEMDTGTGDISYKNIYDTKVSEDGKTIITKVVFGNNHRLAVSKDSGVSWELRSPGNPQNDFEFSVSDDLSNIIVWENNGSAYYSENYGEVFSQIFKNVTVKKAVLSDDGKVITAFIEENYRLKLIQTSDYGRSYKEIGNGLDFTYYSDMAFSQDRKSFFVKVSNTIFTSKNGGESWTQINQNINTIYFSNFIIGNNLDPVLFYETNSYNYRTYIYKMKK